MRLLAALLLLPLGGCVFTNAASTPITSLPPPAQAKNPAQVAVLEGNPAPGRDWVVLGTIQASARSLNLLSSDPTRADVDEALRAEAARLGGDAVTMVSYRTDSVGLASRGRMVGQGSVIAYR